MTFLPDLSADQLVSLRGDSDTPPSYRGKTLVSLCPNTNVYTARINQSSFNNTLAQLTYDGGSGTLGDVMVGMTVLISHTNDRTAAFFRGRIRKAPTASIFYINETHGNQFDNDDYVFVIEDFAVREKLAVYNTVTDVLYPDWDVAFRELKPVIYGLQGAYTDWTSGGVYTISFAPSALAATSGASISSWSWDVGDGTITVGTSSTQNITATFPAGFRWVHLTVTDSGGRTATRHIPVWAHTPNTTTNLLLWIGDVEVTTEIGAGPTATIPAFAQISSILDSTLLCVWVDEKYNGVAENIVNNIAFVGRLRTEESTTRYDDFGQMDAETRFVVEGPLEQLARLQMPPIEIINDATPTAFNQVNDVTAWRAIALILSEYSTFLELHSLSFDVFDNTYEYLGEDTEESNILAAINRIASGINAQMQMNLAGEAEVVRHASMLEDDADRDALTTVANWDTQDFVDLFYSKDYEQIVGFVEGHGASMPASGEQVVAHSAAHLAPGPGEGDSALSGQVLTAGLTQAEAETELNKRTGHYLAMVQIGDTLRVQHLDGYWFMVPAVNLWHTWTLGGTETARGVVLTTATRWLLQSVSVTHEIVTGTRRVTAEYVKETSGTPGETVAYEDNWEFQLPTYHISWPQLPALQIPSIGLLTPPYYGTRDIGVFCYDGYIYRTAMFGVKLEGPDDWDRISMGVSGSYLLFEVDPGSPKYLGTGNTVNAWVVTTTGIYYLEDIGEADGAMSVTLQHSFSYTRTTRAMHVKRSAEGCAAVVTYHSNAAPYGVWVAYTTNRGTTWTEAQITGHYDTGMLSNAFAPGVFWSYRTNRIYTIAHYATNTWPSLDIYESDDNGATWARSSDFDPEGQAGMSASWRIETWPGHIHFPADVEACPNDDIYYWTRHITGNHQHYLSRAQKGVSGGAMINQDLGTPDSRWGYYPRNLGDNREHFGRWNFHTYPNDMTYKAGIFYTHGGGLWRPWRDIGNGWEQMPNWEDTYEKLTSIGISGNNPDLAYLMGYNMLGYIPNLTVDDPDFVQYIEQRGNLLAAYPGSKTFDFLIGL